MGDGEANRDLDAPDAWIRTEAIPFTSDPTSFDFAVDRVLSSFAEPLELVGLGEALHGGEELLLLRNRIFRRLVERHGFSAIAVESSLPRGRAVNDFVAGRGSASFEEVAQTGFSHGFGRLEANRELVEWMRECNHEPGRRVPLRFYGFDSPTEMMYADSPRALLSVPLDYLDGFEGTRKPGRRERIDRLVGPDAGWENPTAMMDPDQSVGLSPEATALRVETEDLIADLRLRRPELVERGGHDRFREALHYASMTRELLDYHAVVARKEPPGERFARLLGMRDAMMAANLAYIVRSERGRGRVLAFAHNSHLQRGPAEWRLGPDSHRWWPAGAHLGVCLGPRYAVIGSAVGASAENGIGEPEPGTLEARFARVSGAGLFVPTHGGSSLPGPELVVLPVRAGSARNLSYFPLAPRSIADFDWIAFIGSTGYTRGGPPLP